MNKMISRSKTIYLKDNQTLTEWVRVELKDKLSNRNRAVHMATDMGVPNITLHRFIHGKSVKSEFYDKAFNYLMK
jgi:hypothetical protein